MLQKAEYIVLPDLEKKNDEAIHDAMAYFEKKCPYCQVPLFSGHIRNKIHIDHFIPISKGGQNVPWNILPVCQRCNGKKNSKKPNFFLSENILIKCEKYLESIKEKYIGEIQIELEKYQQIKRIFSNQIPLDELLKNKIAIISSVYEIINGRKIINSDTGNKNPFDNHSFIEDHINRFFKIPSSTDEIKKLTSTELHNIIQQKVNFKIPKYAIGKALKKMGFYTNVERISEKEVKRVFYVSEVE